MAMNLEMSLIKMWLQKRNYLFNGHCTKYHNNRPNQRPIRTIAHNPEPDCHYLNVATS